VRVRPLGGEVLRSLAEFAELGPGVHVGRFLRGVAVEEEVFESPLALALAGDHACGGWGMGETRVGWMSSVSGSWRMGALTGLGSDGVLDAKLHAWDLEGRRSYIEDARGPGVDRE